MFKEKVNAGNLPSHIAIIMDGNGRWAREKGENRIFGHQNGVRSVRNVTEACAELGIGNLTLYAFSTENWQRPQAEVDALMSLLVSTISGEMKTLNDNNISLHAIGNLAQLPKDCYAELMDGIKKTSVNTGMKLILALSYSARWDILNAVKKLLDENNGAEFAESLNEATFKSYLTTSQFPDPELLIRTSGEKRISNFLLWEMAYTELYFCEKLWPDFDKEDLYEAIVNFQQRERRFGMTSEQIKI